MTHKQKTSTLCDLLPGVGPRGQLARSRVCKSLSQQQYLRVGAREIASDAGEERKWPGGNPSGSLPSGPQCDAAIEGERDHLEMNGARWTAAQSRATTVPWQITARGFEAQLPAVPWNGSTGLDLRSLTRQEETKR